MMSRRTWWTIFSACALLVLAGLTWLTVEMLRLERVEQRARGEIEYEGAVRLALWRMESWLAPQLARESTRPYFEYLPYYPHRRAYDSMWRSIVPDEVQTPSPLLTYESDLVLLHFQVDEAGRVASPQVPSGNALDVAQSTLVTTARIEQMQERLKRLDQIIGDARDLRTLVDEAETSLKVLEKPAVVAAALDDAIDSAIESKREWAQAEVSKLEQGRRAQSMRSSRESQYVAPQQRMAAEDPLGASSSELLDVTCQDDLLPTIDVGAFVSIWTDDLERGCVDVDGVERCVLVLLRRVSSGEETRVQGMLLDWSTLREQLIGQIDDLFPEVELRLLSNAADAAANEGRALVQIPVAMIVAPPVAVNVSGLTSMRLTILIVWLVILSAVIAVAMTLRASVAYGESRSRFASAVTHELRTPLTTFRMYSEMLAAGMITDATQRQSYLETLHGEADRLAALVENVLAYARLERGRTTLAPRDVSVDDVQAPLQASVTRCAERAGATVEWTVDIDGAARLETDPEVLTQIVLNLVDNACKYGAAEGENAAIHITVSRAPAGAGVTWAVCDAGPGIDAAQQRAIFEPFDRGGRPPGETTPGLGLGLALSRGLARRLGGDLHYRESARGGACFVVRMPESSTG